MARPPESRTPLLDFPEWEYVDTQLPVWGLRHRRTANPIYIVQKSWDFTLPPSALCGTSFSYRAQPAPNLALRYHFSEEVRELLSKGLSKMQSPRLISPLVAECEWAIHDGSNMQGPGAAPTYAAFIARHFMGYIACP